MAAGYGCFSARLSVSCQAVGLSDDIAMLKASFKEDLA